MRPDGVHWQLENLSVHDGSLFPTSIGANPQLSIYGLVNKLATAARQAAERPRGDAGLSALLASSDAGPPATSHHARTHRCRRACGRRASCGSGEPAWAGVGALLILFGYALVLGRRVRAAARSSTAATRRRRATRMAAAARPGGARCTTAPRVFCWRQPFRSNAEPDHLPCGERGRRGVVFVHGFVCNRGLWNPLMRAPARARRALRRGQPRAGVRLDRPTMPTSIEAARARASSQRPAWRR